jgi:hypothetical protein
LSGKASGRITAAVLAIHDSEGQDLPSTPVFFETMTKWFLPFPSKASHGITRKWITRMK